MKSEKEETLRDVAATTFEDCGEICSERIGTETVAEYDPQAIEKKWQARWNADHAFEADADPSKPKYYVLEMLPYPSGTHAHGAHAQLHDWRRGRAIPAHAGISS